MPRSLRDVAYDIVEPFGGSTSGLIRVRLQAFAARNGDSVVAAPSLEALGLSAGETVLVTSRVDEGLLASIDERIARYGGDIKQIVVDEFKRFVQEERP